MHLYLSGPMTGLPDFNYPAFHEAARFLRSCGHSVFNPAEQHDGATHHPREFYMKADLAAITTGGVEALVVLPGWEGSQGANLEVSVARGIGLPVLTYPEMQPVDGWDKLDKPTMERVLSARVPVGANTPAAPRKRQLNNAIGSWEKPVFDPYDLSVAAHAGAKLAETMKTAFPDMKFGDKPNCGADLGDPSVGITCTPETIKAHTLFTDAVVDVPPSGEVRVTDPVTGGQKGSKPERFGLMPMEPLRELARVYGAGSLKYKDRNWELGYQWHLCFDALIRHATDFWKGIDIDPESGLHHLAHCAWHCLALMEFGRTYKAGDDRAKT